MGGKDIYCITEAEMIWKRILGKRNPGPSIEFESYETVHIFVFLKSEAQTFWDIGGEEGEMSKEKLRK